MTFHSTNIISLAVTNSNTIQDKHLLESISNINQQLKIKKQSFSTFKTYTISYFKKSSTLHPVHLSHSLNYHLQVHKLRYLNQYLAKLLVIQKPLEITFAHITNLSFQHILTPYLTQQTP